MRLDFNILWIDDQPTYIKSGTSIIEKHIKDTYSLNCVVEERDDIEEIIETIDYKNIDLILIDFDLGDTNGFDHYVKIRDKCLTDVIFYSGGNKMDIGYSNAKFKIEASYFTTSKQLMTKVKQVIGKIVERSESIENLRGMFLDHTVKFDKKILLLIDEYYYKYTDKKKVINDEIKRIFEKSHEDNGLFLKRIEASDNYFDQIHNDFRYDANKRAKTLHHIILENKIDIKECKSFLEDYKQEIIEFRNKLAHAEIGEYIEIRKTKYLVDNMLHKKLRDNIKKYELVLNEVNEQLKNLPISY